jgi:4-oxalocrotonate tautomerase
MPNIIVEAGMLTKEKKNELIRRFTKTASEIMEIPEASFSVLIKENPIENWGVGGKPLEEVLKMMNHS